MPVTCFNCTFDFVLSAAHAAFQTMVDTRSVSDDQGRTMVAFSFQQSFYQLVLVCAHCNLCNVNVAIAHSHHTQVFFLNSLTGSSELSNCTSRSSFGSLTACVGVNFCIEYQNVYIFAGSQYVVQTAVTDIVSPAVTTEDPLRFFNQLIFVFQYVGNDVLSFCICASIAFQCSYQRRMLLWIFHHRTLCQPKHQQHLQRKRRLLSGFPVYLSDRFSSV